MEKGTLCLQEDLAGMFLGRISTSRAERQPALGVPWLRDG